MCWNKIQIEGMLRLPLGLLPLSLVFTNVKSLILPQRLSESSACQDGPPRPSHNYIPRQFYKTPLSRNTRIRFSPPNTRRLVSQPSPPNHRRLTSASSQGRLSQGSPPTQRRLLSQASPQTQRRLMSQGSPPAARRILSRRLAPVLSMDSLIAAINYSDVSYLDTGDVMYEQRTMHPEYSGSVPDLKKIFVTDYL